MRDNPTHLRNPEWAELSARGLLHIAPEAIIHPTAQFTATDRTGTARPITIGPHARIGAYTVIHGGTTLEPHAEVGSHSTIGEPETGYALRAQHPGTGAATLISAHATLRSGTVVYAGTTIGAHTTIGHNTVLRTGVTIGTRTQIGHMLTIERGTHIGNDVRCSPLTHLTAEMHIGDGAFIGARVATINDKHLIWRDPTRQTPLDPPRIENNAKIGTGTVLLPGVVIGTGALVGAGSVVTHDVAPHTVAFGNPARPNGGAR